MEKLDEIICRLKTISKLEPEQKLEINSSANLQIADNTYYNALRRTWYGDSRTITLEYIEKLLQDIEKYYQSLLNSPDNLMNKDGQTKYEKDTKKKICVSLLRLSNDLSNSIGGVRNLMETYKGDKAVSSELETIIENMILTNKQIVQKFEELQQNNVGRIDLENSNTSNE